ncbi:HDOD domain-containing protein [Sulfuriflexus sp.]|uniref:HDOD domain-containing protein n=1 Tax=Sulfuriflexus sp. TaxID=2015443 RepID=UPI0028CF2AB8|nr:HDOD domain-containing protein [Sulfuriflexus sp.]MDT8405347.1 HDOD domain-containing protein [Sulfuriflexus sp.]
MPLTAKNLISAVSDLVSLPETVLRVSEMVDDPRSSAADIGELIRQDPGLAARLLHIANSPFYGFPSRIDSIPLAITIIGTDQLRDILLATSSIQTFSAFPNELVSLETFWHHSLRCAVIARSLAAHLHETNVERYFTAGLLHDIGYLIIYHQLPELASRTLTHSNRNREIVHIVEQEILGFDHCMVGGELLRQWNLPPSLCEAVEFHHTPHLARQYRREAAIIHIANFLANTMPGRAGGDVEESEALDVTTLQTAGLTPDILQRVLRDADAQLHETMEIMIYNEAA